MREQSPSLVMSRTRIVAGVAFVALLTCLAYWPAMHGGFLLDDDALLTQNQLIKSADGLARFWFSTEPFDYWPMTNSSFWLEWRLWGTNTTGYHVTNLILHISSALLIWMILKKLGIPGAYLAALLFAVHPVNVESVAWIAQRKNTLAMVFFLLSILWYLRQEEETRSKAERRDWGIGRWYWMSLLAFVAAMLSKGSVAILPLLLLITIWWRYRRITRADLLRTGPFFLVAAALTGVNIWFQMHLTGETIRSANFAQRLAESGAIVWFYLSKAVAPIGLTFIYPEWNFSTDQALWWLPLLAALALTGVLWWHRGRAATTWGRSLLFGWGFFCIALVPVMGFTDVYFMKYALVADHYQYIALIGVVALAAAEWSAWRDRSRRVDAAPMAVAAIVVGALTMLTWQQSAEYASLKTLYRATINKNPTCWLAYLDLGNILASEGKSNDALACFLRAMQLRPGSPEILSNLGSALIQEGQTQKGMEAYEAALRLKPDFPEAQYNFGNALVRLGRQREAIEHYERAVQLKPDYAQAWNNLGMAMVDTGQAAEAIDKFEHALRWQSNYAAAEANLAFALESVQRRSEAIAAAQKALQLARAQGQAALVDRIQTWMTEKRIEPPE